MSGNCHARLWLALAALALLFTAGCAGGTTYPGATVSGTVTLDGKPIEEGTINFVPTTPGQGQAASATIAGGKYSAAKVPLGKVTVNFVAQHKTGKKIPGSSEPIDEIINLIPSKYAAGVPTDISGDKSDCNFELK